MMPSEKPALVHRPGPRPVIYGAMVFLGLIVLPAFIVSPKSMLTPGGIAGMLVFLGFELVLLAIALRRVEVRVHAAVLHLLSVRWPLGARAFEVPVTGVRDVVVQRNPRSPTKRIALAMHDGRELPLTSSYFGNVGHMERDASALRQLLD